MSNISYIKLLNTIEEFASAHLQVKKFGSDFPGQMPNFATTNEAYPILFVSPSTSIFNQNTTTFELVIYCWDVIQKDRENINNILSDTHQILSDLDKWFRDGDIYGIDLISSSTVEPLNNGLLDYASGWQLKMVFDVNTYTVCEIPFGSIPSVVTEVCDIVYSPYLTCNELSNCSVIETIENDITTINTVLNDLTGSTPSEIVYFDSINPNLSGTTFDPDEQNQLDTLYVSENIATPGQPWIWNGNIYTGYTGTTISSTPFLLFGTYIDAGSNKTAMVYRNGGLAATSFNTKKNLTSTGISNNNKWFKVFDYILTSNYIGDSFKIQMNEYNTASGVGKSVMFNILVKRQDPSTVVNVNVESGLSSFDLSNFEVLYNSTTKRLAFYYKPTTTYTFTNWLVLNARATTTSEIVWYNTLIGTSLSAQTSNPITIKTITLNKVNGAYTLPTTAPTVGQVLGYASAGVSSWVNANANDIYVTGGTYSNGSTTFTNNSGGTFNIDGYYTGSSASILSALKTKSGVVAYTSFTGSPYTYNVVFTTAFTDSLYSPQIIGVDSRAWSVSNITANGFRIETNSSIILTNNVYWTATKHGEN